jgi:hypothetical protein
MAMLALGRHSDMQIKNNQNINLLRLGHYKYFILGNKQIQLSKGFNNTEENGKQNIFGVIIHINQRKIVTCLVDS